VKGTVLLERLTETLIANIPINIARLMMHPMGGYNHMMERKPDDVGSLFIDVHVDHVDWSVEHDIPIVAPFYLQALIPILLNDPVVSLEHKNTLPGQKGIHMTISPVRSYLRLTGPPTFVRTATRFAIISSFWPELHARQAPSESG
jgi:hypothetical protein